MNETLKKSFQWNVYSLCYKPIPSSYAIIILNAGLRDFISHSHITSLWRNAAHRLCVDGGTNDFYSLIHKPQDQNGEVLTKATNEIHCSDKEVNVLQNGGHSSSPLCTDIPLPDIISGDFDSVDPHILSFYSSLGVRIVHTPDQDKTDFTKALMLLRDNVITARTKITHVIVIAAINSTRFDHVLGHLSTLYKVNSLLPFSVIMMSEGTLLWLLDTGSHQLQVHQDLLNEEERSWCGYASFSENVIVSTSGLKWDVCKRIVAFGKLISTSNTYAPGSNGDVFVECSSPLLWFMDVAAPLYFGVCDYSARFKW